MNVQEEVFVLEIPNEKVVSPSSALCLLLEVISVIQLLLLHWVLSKYFGD